MDSTTSPPATPPTTAIAKTEKTPTPMGVRFENIDQAFRFCNAIAQTEMVPKAYRGRPYDVLAAVQQGAELGLAPMQSLGSLCVVNGIVSLWGDGLLAVIIAAPAYVKHEEYFEVNGERRELLTGDDFKLDTTAAVCTMWRRGQAPITNRYTIAHAKRAQLWTKAGPWQTNPDRMLRFRARAFCARDTFPDVVRGIRTVEEARDIPVDDAPPVVREVRRVSETPTPSTEPAPEPPATDAPELVTLDPVAVKGVAAFLGGYTVTLANGLEVDATHEQDALDLEKFVGTPTQVRLTCRRVVDRLELVSLAVAE